MTDKLEVLVSKRTETISIGDIFLEIGYAIYTENNTKDNRILEVRYRDRVPAKYNDNLISWKNLEFGNLITKKYPDLTAKTKDYFGRKYLEITIPKDRYELRIRN